MVSDQRPADRPRHHHPLGGPHGDDGHVQHEGSLGSTAAFPSHVAINPTILDGKGERMSKSKGNGVDPVDIIDTHGADALRFTLTKWRPKRRTSACR